MMLKAVHTCEVEEVDTWMWEAGSSINTPEVSFPGAQPTMLHQPWLSRLVSWETVVAIFGSDVGCVHNCCIRSTSGTLGHHDWEGCVKPVVARFGHQYPWYWARRSVDGGGGQRGWESEAYNFYVLGDEDGFVGSARTRTLFKQTPNWPIGSCVCCYNMWNCCNVVWAEF